MKILPPKKYLLYGMSGIFLWLKACCFQGFPQLGHQLRVCQGLSPQEKEGPFTVPPCYQVSQQRCDWAERGVRPTQGDSDPSLE